MRGTGGLTGGIELAVGNPALEAAGYGSEAFVTGGEGHDGEEGEEEAGRAADVPPAEDDTEVGGVPGEQHLRADDRLALE
jgi:hypothetical protein